jgi:parallel beta-helix repeat protein
LDVYIEGGQENMKKTPVLLNKTLVIGTIILLLGICVNPSFGIIVERESNDPIVNGNTLYVGGSGPGNYTMIQDAINDASDGDRVFVFDDSSPYYENIVVNKSIIIQGENKNTTIIDGSNNGHGVNIIADDVTITGFTIQNCGTEEDIFTFTSGIFLSSNNTKITDNIIIHNKYAISNVIHFSAFPLYRDNIITNNHILYNYDGGIFLINISGFIISRNIISQTDEGIMLTGAIHTNISYNIITENGLGLLLVYSYNTMIYRNNISYNNIAFANFVTSAEKILQNNFIGNKKFSAVSNQRLLTNIWYYIYLKLIINVPIRRNVWKGNYWNEPRSLPYIIPGWFVLRIWIDWYPAKEPYDIEI